jgi:hypothetical protein
MSSEDKIKIGLYYFYDEKIRNNFEKAVKDSINEKFDIEFVDFDCYKHKDFQNLPDVFVFDTCLLKSYKDTFQLLDPKEFELEDFYKFSVLEENDKIFGLPQVLCSNFFFSRSENSDSKKDSFCNPNLSSYEYVRVYQEFFKNLNDEKKALEETKKYFDRMNLETFEDFKDKKDVNMINYFESVVDINDKLYISHVSNCFFIDLAVINSKVKDEKLKNCKEVLKHICNGNTFLEATEHGKVLNLLPPRQALLKEMKHHQDLYDQVGKIINDNIKSIYHANFELSANEIKIKSKWIEEHIQKTEIGIIRCLAADVVQKANSGHPGMPIGMAPSAYVLWKYFLNVNPEVPNWINRDRFVLSAGHGSVN